ncbi:MAG: hypothetical protein ABIS45_00305 [Burkholderiales bacterium]
MEPTLNPPNTFSRPNPVTGEDMLGKTVSGAHSAVIKTAAATDEAVRRAKPVIDRVAAGAHVAVDKVAGVATPTVAWLSTRSASVKATHQKVTADTRRYISANALKSVGVSLVAGLLIGRFMR